MDNGDGCRRLASSDSLPVLNHNDPNRELCYAVWMLLNVASDTFYKFLKIVKAANPVGISNILALLPT